MLSIPPPIGLGTWKLADDGCEDVVVMAIKAGVRHIDTATMYNDEADVGAAVRKCIDQGIVTREELWITTKLLPQDCASPEAGLDRSLQALGLQYVDLYLVHWPVALRDRPDGGVDINADEDNLATIWGRMAALPATGKCRFVGGSNFSESHVNQCINVSYSTGGAPFSVNQIESSPMFPNAKLIAACQKLDVHTTLYRPLGGYNRNGSAGDARALIFEAEPVQALARALKCTPAQAALAWSLARWPPGMCSLIPKSSNESRLRENLASCGLVEQAQARPELLDAVDRLADVDARFGHRACNTYARWGIPERW